MRAGRMRKQCVTSATALCLAVGSMTGTAGGLQASGGPLQKTVDTVAPGGEQVYDTTLQVNDLLTVWAANSAPAGGADLRVRLQRWGFSKEFPGTVAMVDVGSLTVPPGTSRRIDQVATTTAPYQVVVDAPGATVEVPFALEPFSVPGSGQAAEHQGQEPGATSFIVATPPNGRDVRYLSEPAAGLTRWRVDFAPGDTLAAQVDHLGFDRPGSPLVACLLDPYGGEVASVSVPTGGTGTLRYVVPMQGHYVIDMGCRPDAPPSAFRPYLTPRPGRIPGSVSFVGAHRLTPKAGTQNGGALDRFWRIDLEAGQLLDVWLAATDPETAHGTLCIDGPSPANGLVRVAAKTVPRGRADQILINVPWTGRYVINGACLPGEGLFEILVN